MKLTKEQVAALDDMLDRADAHGGDIATKVDTTGKYIRTPWPLCEEIVGQIVTKSSLHDKKILVVDTVEFVPVLLAFGAEKCNITYIAPYKYKGDMIASIIGVHVVQQSLLEWAPDMKFDVVIGNPPYQAALTERKKESESTNNANLYEDFIHKAMDISDMVAFVVPSGWFNVSIADKIKKAGLKSVTFVNKEKNFPGMAIRSGTCFYIQDRSYFGKIEINTGHSVYEIDRNSTLGFEGRVGYSIIEKIESKLQTLGGQRGTFTVKKNSKNIEGVLKNHPELTKEQGPQKILIYSGGDTEPIKYLYSSSIRQQPYYCVAFPYSAQLRKIGKPVLVEPGTLISDRNHVYEFSSRIEAENFIKYINSKFMKAVFYVKKVKDKINTKKDVFNYVSKLNFIKELSDNDLYTYFNLSKIEIDYIETTIK